MHWSKLDLKAVSMKFHLFSGFWHQSLKQEVEIDVFASKKRKVSLICCFIKRSKPSKSFFIRTLSDAWRAVAEAKRWIGEKTPASPWTHKNASLEILNNLHLREFEKLRQSRATSYDSKPWICVFFPVYELRSGKMLTY